MTINLGRRRSSIWRKPDQIIQPFEYGEPFSKKTCLWLKGLPQLTPTNIVEKGEQVKYSSGKSMPKWEESKYMTKMGNINSIAIGKNITCNHDNCLLIGENIESKHDSHFIIKFDEVFIDKKLNNHEIEAIKYLFCELQIGGEKK